MVKTIANDFGYNTRKITVRLKRLQNIGIKYIATFTEKKKRIRINVVRNYREKENALPRRYLGRRKGKRVPNGT